jgi:anti-anti-sigma factor
MKTPDRVLAIGKRGAYVRRLPVKQSAAHQQCSSTGQGALAMACDLLRFKLSKNGTAETLSVAGELDISSAPAFEQAVSQALDGQGQEFRLDMSGLTFMDSTGAQALVRVHKHVERLGRRLVVASPTHAVRVVLDILGLDQVIDVQA